MRGLTTRWSKWRDQLVSRPDFRDYITRVPLLRGIARRRARELFDLCAGFVYSQILFSCVRVGLFEILAESPLRAIEIGRRTGLPAAAAVHLLEAAEALDLIERRDDGCYGLGRLGVAMPGNCALAAMVAHHEMLYQDLADPLRLLRDASAATRLSEYWAYAAGDDPQALLGDRTRAYSELMRQSNVLVANEVLYSYPMSAHRRLLDVGGGEAVFAIAAARRYPHLRAVAFDLPAVAGRAAHRIEAEGIGDRVCAVAGSFLSGKLPVDADLISLLRVLHDHDDADALTLLRTCRDALVPRGRLLIAEPMADVTAARRTGRAYFGFYFLAMRRGRLRSVAEVEALLGAAGYGRSRRIPTALPVLASIVVADRGSG